MSRRLWSVVVAVAGLTTATPDAQGQVVFEAAPNGANGWDVVGASMIAESFVLAGTATFNHLTLWGIVTPAGATYTGDIAWQILTAPTANPPVMLHSGTATPTSTVRGMFGTLVSHTFSLALGTITLGPGNYWLALEPSATTSSFFWETSDVGDGTFHAVNPDGSFTNIIRGDDLAFRLENTAVVPEPISTFLVGTGLFGVGAAARRRKKQLKELV